jgi:hypothetical protein
MVSFDMLPIMQTVQTSSWQFEIPHNWVRCQNESSDLYFEEIDGSKGLYLKEIMSSKVGESSQSLAEEIQDIYLGS